MVPEYLASFVISLPVVVPLVRISSFTTAFAFLTFPIPVNFPHTLIRPLFVLGLYVSTTFVVSALLSFLSRFLKRVSLLPFSIRFWFAFTIVSVVPQPEGTVFSVGRKPSLLPHLQTSPALFFPRPLTPFLAKRDFQHVSFLSSPWTVDPNRLCTTDFLTSTHTTLFLPSLRSSLLPPGSQRGPPLAPLLNPAYTFSKRGRSPRRQLVAYPLIGLAKF